MAWTPRVRMDRTTTEQAFQKLRASVDLETEITLSAEEAAQLWRHIREEQYRHRRHTRLPVGNPYE